MPAITPTPQASANVLNVETEVLANWMRSESRDELFFSGDVEVLRAQQSILSQQLTLQQNPQRLFAEGDVEFKDERLALSADSMQLDDASHYSLFNQASFTLGEIHLRGTASRLEQHNEFLRDFTDVRYTTCDPGDNAWSLSASRLILDDEAGMGTAHHAVLRVGPVPVFYFPWFRFPITGERMTGFLPPLVNYSSNKGYLLITPFYWNIADNLDMTISPADYQKRGLQLNTENRYLFGNTYGEFRYSTLDDTYKNPDLDPAELALLPDERKRWSRYWKQESVWESGVRLDVLGQKVSDREFMYDFGRSQKVAEVDHLRSMARLTVPMGDWKSTVLVDRYQNLLLNATEASDQYQRRPQITLTGNLSTDDGTPWLSWNSEYINLAHNVRTEGKRLRINPTLSYPIEGDYYFVTPSVQLDATAYELSEHNGDIQSIERNVPLYSIDSGLFFERRVDDAGRWLQTLEPRLYLLYVPYRDQSDIPLFDSALLSESYSQLFRNNRFSGGDRIGDSRQISLALTTRFIDQDDGRDVFDASVGQAFYNAPREVNLGTRVDDARDRSGIITQLGFRPTRDWKLNLTRVYNQETNEADQKSASLRYANRGTVLNLDYQMRRDELEQINHSLVYPLTPRWKVFGKHQKSILHERPVQYLGGLSYDSCCWRMDIIYEALSDTAFTQTDHSVSLQFTFKGFGSAGQDVDAILEEGIAGYQAPQ